jgi:mannose-6-phosphate isomerase
MKPGPARVEPRFVERVWGRTDLSPLFGRHAKRIGEVWFPLAESFPLLVKFLFTDERLSVQVHPDDSYAREHENSRGKTEMWHILDTRQANDAAPCIALGFREAQSGNDVRARLRNGTVEEVLNWIPVHPGETYLINAGVVHALGAGIVLCEIQQNSDVTYRLYDYGRPRELHVDKALAVADMKPYEGRTGLPVRSPHFTTELVKVEDEVVSELPGEHLLIGIEGKGTIAGQSFQAGEVWHVPEGAGAVRIMGRTASLLRTRGGSAEP